MRRGHGRETACGLPWGFPSSLERTLWRTSSTSFAEMACDAFCGSGGRVGGVGHSLALQRDSDPGAMLAGKGCDSDAVPPGPAPPVLAPNYASEAQPHPIVLEPQHEPARRGISLAG